MFTPSDKCPRRDACVQNGKGLIHMKDLTDKEGLYNHGRLFAHVTVDPGCSIGDHPHDHETEFYYIIKGEVFSEVLPMEDMASISVGGVVYDLTVE